MIVIRGTKKFLDRVGQPTPGEVASSGVLGDWYANPLFWRPQVAMFVNERSLLPVVVPLAPATSVVSRLPAAFADVATRIGVDDRALTRELDTMSEYVLAKTANRSVVGVMTEFVHLGEAFREGRSPVDPLDLSLWLAQVPCGPLYRSSVSPDRELKALLGETGASGLDAQLEESVRIGAKVVVAPSEGDTMTNARTVHRLKVTLRQVKPVVWRRIEVVSDIRLSELAGTLEAAMGWVGGHLHAFEAGGATYEVPEDGFGRRQTRDERKVRLGEVLPDVGAKLRWDYDFGDGWMHDVVVEAIEPPADGATYPRCLAGRRACPPDDCGGPWGYSELLEALADPLHPEHAERAEWIDGGFDPKVFDVEEATEMMRSPRPLQGW